MTTRHVAVIAQKTIAISGESRLFDMGVKSCAVRSKLVTTTVRINVVNSEKFPVILATASTLGSIGFDDFSPESLDPSFKCFGLLVLKRYAVFSPKFIIISFNLCANSLTIFFVVAMLSIMVAISASSVKCFFHERNPVGVI